ncbi:hypothetical protein FBU30_007314 [Linnemannia zychae]|nr:hypothetical protein FBU30_007314 [Linnemannia zychae]
MDSVLDAGVPIASAFVSTIVLLIPFIYGKRQHAQTGYTLLSQQTEEEREEPSPSTYYTLLALCHAIRTSSTTISLMPHLVSFFLIYIPITFFRLRTTLLQETTLSLTLLLVSYYFFNNFLLLFISLSYGSTPQSTVHFKDFDVVKEGRRYPCPEQHASWIERALFTWGDPFIRLGFNQTLKATDIWDFCLTDYISVVARGFHASVATSRMKHGFLTQLIIFFKKRIESQLIWAICWCCLSFVGPLGLERVLYFIKNKDTIPVQWGYFYVSCTFVGMLMSTIAYSQTLWRGCRTSMQVRGLVLGEMYSKVLRRKDKAGQALKNVTHDDDDDETSENSNKDNKKEEIFSNGAVNNMISIDTNEIAQTSHYSHQLLILVLEIFLTTIFLFRIMGQSAFAGIFVMACLIPFNTRIARLATKIQVDLIAATDKRVEQMTELLQVIRMIKYFSWERNFYEKVDKARELELAYLRKRMMFWILGTGLWYGTPVAVSVSSFFVYTKVYGNVLTAEVAFPALTLFNVLKGPMVQFPNMIAQFIRAKVSAARMDRFLAEEEVQRYSDPALESASSKPQPGDPTIGFKYASFSYAGKTEQAAMDRARQTGTRMDGHYFELKNLNFHFPVGELSIITGPTGSGKTSMLLALLGEINTTHGRAFLPDRTNHTVNATTGLTNGIAYVAQQSWLLNDSIRNNILFGSSFDQYRYDQVVEMCALKRDFEILEDGDETEIGEQGVTLSGGQKQRVALARAVYSRAGHILMDDCLSAVDAHTAKWLFSKCLMGPLMVGRTRILVTHSISLTLQSAAFAVVLKDGMVTVCGTPNEVLESGALDTDFLTDDRAIDKNDEIDEALNADPTSSSSNDDYQNDYIVVNDGSSVATLPVKEKKKLIEAESKAEGALSKAVYMAYFQAMGTSMFWTILLSCFVANQALQVSSDAWLRVWAAANEDNTDNNNNSVTRIGTPILQMAISTFQSISKPTMDSLSYYLGVYISLSAIYIVSVMIREIVQYIGSLNASRILHRKALKRVLHSPIRFFDTTPLGQIINRFTRDMDTLDQQVVNVSANVMGNFLSTLTITGVIAYVTPQFLLPGFVISILFVAIAAYYIRCSREVKRHEDITNSPVYSHFAETLNGVTTIRAFGYEERFNTLYQELLDEHNRPYFYSWVCNRWLSIRVDILSAFITLFAGLFIILHRDTIDTGAAGLSMAYSLAFTDNVLWFVRTFTYNEINMNCVQRVEEYTALPQEAPEIIESYRPPAGWPSQGEIQVHNLVMRYAPDDPAVVRDISFHISPCEKIGIVGRTGAGKSTLAVAFFRFMEMTSGKIEIDGVDISRIGLHDLRSNLTIIPQDPVLFVGTVRSNLDPFQKHSDADLWAVLKRVHFVNDGDPSNHELANDYGFGNLDSEVKENGSNFSQGQRQLIGLARALLKNSKVIIMDEATASVDHATDAKIQATIREGCRDITLLTIAHRLRTIIDFDRVLVMDHGKIIQMDTPEKLIREVGGIFRTMCQRSGEFELLLELADAAAERKRILGRSL